jgi:Subtilase family
MPGRCWLLTWKIVLSQRCSPNAGLMAPLPRSVQGYSCGMGIDQGTSMATPLVAGAAILVRQYFTDGWYPLGIPKPAHKIATPSAALIKATLIGEPPNPAGDLQPKGQVGIRNRSLVRS